MTEKTKRDVDFLLLIVMLVALFLRVYKLPLIPPGPYYDEAANGILAAEIASGRSHPIFIEAYTGKEVLYFYLAAGVMKLLGASLFPLRLTSALVGLLSLIFAYLLAREMFACERNARFVALLSASLMATSYWHVSISRYGFRAISQPLFQSLTLYFLWRGLKIRPPNWQLLLAGAFCGATAYTYLASRAFPLALLPFFIWLILRSHSRKARVFQIAVFTASALAVFAPLGYFFIVNPLYFSIRMSQVSIFNPEVNKGDFIGTLLRSIRDAAGMFSFEGDPQWRFNIPGKCVFNPLFSIFFYLGLAINALKMIKRKGGNGAGGISR